LEEDEEEIVTLLTVELSDTDESQEAFFNDGKVINVDQESLGDNLVEDRINLGVIFALEDAQTEAQPLLEEKEVINTEDQTLLQQEQKEVITLLRGERTEVEESDEAFLSEGDVGNVSDKTLLEEEVQEVVGTGLSAALEDTQAKAETLTEIKDISDIDDGTLHNEKSKEVVASLAVDSTNSEGSA